MKKYKFTALIFVIILLYSIAHNGYSINLNDVYAFPVPFIPRIHKFLTIKISDATHAKCSIYDINGDVVKKLSGTANMIWNGRNDNGEIVAPGLYIIKIELEGIGGEYKKKIIRILVQ